MVFQAADTVQVKLAVVEVCHVLVAVVHIPVVGVVAIGLSVPPPVAVVADIAETVTRTAVAVRQCGKTVLVLAVAVFEPATL